MLFHFIMHRFYYTTLIILQVVPRYDEMENLIKTRIICVSWTADHRIIDGATMARFSNLWKKYLEMPTSLFFD